MPPLRRLHIPVLAGGLAVVIGVGLVLSPPSRADAFGALGRAEAAAPDLDAVLPAAGPGLVFPGVDGVDLLDIGYRGVDLDAVTVADLDRPLPELPVERATDLRARIVVATAHVEGLRAAEYVLYETARSLRSDVRAAGRVVEERRDRHSQAEQHAAVLRAAAAQRPGLDGEGPQAEAVDWQALGAATDAAEAARVALAEAEQQVAEREASRQAHRAALDLTHRAANRMDRHIEYLHNELRHARSGMLAAGRWLAEVERGRRDLPLVAVEGFRVHASIAGALADMVAAARADGIELRGKGYRATARQIELRKQNCGTTEYDIFEKPSGACSPPTAKPHRSLHESGLAVDFRHGEESITSRRSPAYRWLAANAAAYGFFNLASEPWHWSVSAT